jgi:outer membrane protein TolC
VELRALQRRLEIAQRNLSLQQQTTTSCRPLRGGLVGQSDVAQARTNLEATRSRLPEFETSLRAAQNRLAVLLGQPPGTLAAELEVVRPIPVPPLSVAVGVPADLLRRRADVRRAERELAAETARIGVAEGRPLPAPDAARPAGPLLGRPLDLHRLRERLLRLRSLVRWNCSTPAG